jgi:KaiC/GvpD/RAD55 family RecA-like ATPase
MTSSIEIRFLDHARTRTHWNKYGSYVRKDFLSTRATKIIWAAIHKAFEGDTKGRIKKVGLRQILGYAETHHEKEVATVRQVLLRMKKLSPEVAERTLTEFLQRRMTHMALEEGLDLLADPEGLSRLSSVRDMLDNAVRLGIATGEVYSYFKKVTERKGKIRHNLVPTGISQKLDVEALGGGAGSGELLILIGPPGRGKTQALCNIAAHGVSRGVNTLYVVLQDESDVRIARRIDQILLGWPESKIVRQPDEFLKRVAKLHKNSGELVIKDFVQQSVSVYDVRSAVEMMTDTGHKPGLVLIDYLDTMVSHTKDSDQNVVFGKIGHELRRLGRERGFPVWTASQGNRESMDVDNVRLSHIAGAIAKTRAADFVAGMSQKPSERDEGYMRLEVLKTRMSHKHHSIVVFSDEGTMKLWGRKRERSDRRQRRARQARRNANRRGRGEGSDNASGSGRGSPNDREALRTGTLRRRLSQRTSRNEVAAGDEGVDREGGST